MTLIDTFENTNNHLKIIRNHFNSITYSQHPHDSPKVSAGVTVLLLRLRRFDFETKASIIFYLERTNLRGESVALRVTF